MPVKPAKRRNSQFIAAATIISVALVVLFWRIFAYDVTIPAVAENIATSAITAVAEPAVGGLAALVSTGDRMTQNVATEPAEVTSDASTDAVETRHDTTNKTVAEPAAEGTGAPVRITIPVIAVDAAIERVALAADGSMGVPENSMNAAWYELGPSPGEAGSAVIAGHVDWYGGATGVFANLGKVRPGDTVTIQDDNGAAVSFIVKKVLTYAADDDATEIFSSNDGKAHLNLITCGGAWNKDAQQYSERLVVFTDRE